MTLTDFRPQLHGFDFDNRWDLDDNYRNFVRKQIGDAVPLAVEVVVTNPAIGAALLGALGASQFGGGGAAALPARMVRADGSLGSGQAAADRTLI
jgi:hypothetical protein